MKRKILLLSMLVVVVASPFVRADTTPPSEAQVEVIRANCSSAQIGIQRFQQSEKLTRINRGYLYESTLKLMVKFNSRVALNKIDAPELLTLTSDFEKKLKVFTALYTEYDDGLSDVVKQGCRDQPVDFYNKLIFTREKRSELATQVQLLAGLLDSYQAVIDKVNLLIADKDKVE